MCFVHLSAGRFFPSLAQNIFASLHLEDVCVPSDPAYVKVRQMFFTAHIDNESLLLSPWIDNCNFVSNLFIFLVLFYFWFLCNLFLLHLFMYFFYVSSLHFLLRLFLFHFIHFVVYALLRNGVSLVVQGTSRQYIIWLLTATMLSVILLTTKWSRMELN